MIRVLDPGPWIALRDAGCWRQSHLGVSPGGAADPWSHAVANRLVGNADEAAAYEITLRGGRFGFDAAARFALAGAEFDATLDDEPVPSWQTVIARAGQELKLGYARDGARCYLAFAADDGAPLLRARTRTTFTLPAIVRVTPGADAASFDAALRDVFVAGEWTVSPHSDRHGLRLLPAVSGGRLRVARGNAIDGLDSSQGVTWGTVQLPPSGEPLVLMNDQQTTGGYPQLAQVIIADRPRLGQLRPGDRLRFHWIDPDAAVTVLAEQRRRLATVVVPA